MLASEGAKRANVSEEEAKIRNQEDILFATMAEPPTISNAVMHLLGKDDDDDDDNEDTEEAEVVGKSPAIDSTNPAKRRKNS